ncbi:MAG: TIGR03016 family PEP-CTERM system-associated outer membrane protein [Pseudomonadota bacterium]|nr:TIGR03016 family PEP-CTERM system-associated outer membrane protein [Pseudomonadota bacterium]
MTITMAKHARAPAALLALLLAPTVYAEVKFTPIVSGSETYSDNVALQPTQFAQSSFITEITPAFSLLSNGPRLKLSASYQLHLYSYSNKVNNTNNTSSQYQLSLQSKLIDDLLDLNASAARQTTSLTAFGPQGNDSLYSDSNRTVVSTYTISPTLRHRFGGTADAYLRYTRNRVVGDRFLGTTNGDNINANIISGQNFSVVGWGVNVAQDSFSATQNSLSNATVGDTKSQNVEGNLRYRVGQTISLTATAGYDKYDYGSVAGNSTQGASYTGGFVWTPSSRTRLQMSYGRRYYGNTGNLAASYRGHRSALNASYGDTVTTSRQQFLSSTGLNTYDLLNAMLTASIPDPAERAKAIAAYIAATGITPILTNNTNYLSNVFQRQRTLQVGYSLQGAHSTTTLSVQKSRVTALSTQQADSDLLGQNFASLNNNLDTFGGSASYIQRMTSATQLVASLSYQRSKTIDTNITSDNEAVRLGLTHAFDAKLQGSTEIRQVRGSYFNTGNSRYRENAISATISKQF